MFLSHKRENLTESFLCAAKHFPWTKLNDFPKKLTKVLNNNNNWLYLLFMLPQLYFISSIEMYAFVFKMQCNFFVDCYAWNKLSKYLPNRSTRSAAIRR